MKVAKIKNKKCFFCGEKIISGESFCSNCGTKQFNNMKISLAEQYADKWQKKQKGKNSSFRERNKRKIWIAAHIIIAFFIVSKVILAFFINEDLNGITYYKVGEIDIYSKIPRVTILSNDAVAEIRNRGLFGNLRDIANSNIKEQVWIGFHKYDVSGGYLTLTEGSKVDYLQIPEGMKVAISAEEGITNNNIQAIYGAYEVFFNDCELTELKSLSILSLNVTNGQYPNLQRIYIKEGDYPYTKLNVMLRNYDIEEENDNDLWKYEYLFPSLYELEVTLGNDELRYKEISASPVISMGKYVSLKENGSAVIHIEPNPDDLSGKWKIGISDFAGDVNYDMLNDVTEMISLFDYPEDEKIKDIAAVTAFGSLCSINKDCVKEDNKDYFAIEFNEGYLSINGNGFALPEALFKYEITGDNVMTLSIDSGSDIVSTLAQSLLSKYSSMVVPYRIYGEYLFLEIGGVSLVMHR